MKRKHGKRKNADPVLMVYIKGLCISTGITAAAGILLATLLSWETIEYDSLKFMAIPVWTLSAFAGSLHIGLRGRGVLAVRLLIAVGSYVISLALLGYLAFGMIGAPWLIACLCAVVGCAISCAICIRLGNRNGRRKFSTG